MRTQTGQVPEQELVGREHELRALDELVVAARAGQAQVVALRGEPGVGKSALLRHLGDASSGCDVLRASGVESEAELDYAGLHQLVAPLSGSVDRLPPPQREALRAALGMGAGREADPFMVGLAVLGLLAGASAQRPLICLVDDAHRLDQASANVLAFVGRRLAGEAVVLAFAAPHPVEHDFLAGFSLLAVTGLADRDARTLLRSAAPGLLDEGVRRRVVAESGGNPRALLEVSRGPGRPESRDVAHHLRRIESLPAATRLLLLVVAAEPRLEPMVVWRAAGQLGLGPVDAGPAEAEGLIDVGEARFADPLVRVAVYRGAPADERRLVHGALAAATCPEQDPDRHAWHLAHAATGHDEDVASGLERSADRAHARGGLAAAAAARELAVALTPEPARRSERALRAARDTFRSGAHDRARHLLSIAGASAGAGADRDGADRRHAAEVDLLQAQLAVSADVRDATSLLAAAHRLDPLDPARAREARRDAFAAALVRGRLARAGGVVEVADSVCGTLGTSDPADPATGLLGGLARTVVDGWRVGAPALRSAVAAFAASDLTTDDATDWLPLATRSAAALGDEKAWDDLSTRTIASARRTGRLPVLADALDARVALELFAGDPASAGSLSRECAAVDSATGRPRRSTGALLIAAWRGDGDLVGELVVDGADAAAARGDGSWSTLRAWATAMVHNAAREYPEALLAAVEGSAHPEELGIATWSAVELVEAAARSGTPERGHEALRRITDVAAASGTEWALGIAARSRALLSGGPEAEADYLEAIERLGRTRLSFVLARAHLVYGEWLRRADRRADAREQLGRAHALLADMGAEGFAARARRELAATGVTARRRSAGATVDLTEQELQISRLAALGHTNPEIATQLFLSHRTVEWHLRKVFSKLGIRSRKEVSRALGMTAGEHVPSIVRGERVGWGARSFGAERVAS